MQGKKKSATKLRERERERESEITFFLWGKTMQIMNKEWQIYTKSVWIRRDKNVEGSMELKR